MRKFSATLLLAALLVAGSPDAAGDPITIKLGTLAPEGSPWYDALRDMGEAWKQATDGEVELRIYAGGAIGDEPSMVQMMRIGQLKAAGLSGAGLHKIATEVQALQMPLMFRTDAELACVREQVQPRLARLLDDKGFTVLTWADAGWVHFFATVPIVRPEDLKGRKLFVWAGEDSTIEAWKEFGAQPVPLPATEIFTALQSGLIEVVPTTPGYALPSQWFAIANHMTDIKWAPLVGALVVSTKSWRKIPEERRALMLKIAQETGARLQAQTQKFEQEAIAAMQDHGLIVEPVPVEVAAEWERQARAGYGSIVGDLVPADIVAEVERLRDGCREAQ